MATESLNSVVNDVLKNNRKTAKSFIEVYRVGGTRLASEFESRWERLIEGRAGKLDERVRSKLIDAAKKVSSTMTTGIEKVSTGAEKAVNVVYDRAASAVQKMSDGIGNVGNSYATTYFDYVGKVTLPSLKLTRDLSDRVAGGVESLQGRLTPKHKAASRKTTRKVAAKPARAAKAAKAA